MKRFLCIVFCVVLFPVFALADLPDISGLSFDELISLRSKVNLSLMRSSNFQKVTVPSGIWEVGKDIPAGHWSITPAPGCGPDYVIYGSSLKEGGHDIDLFAGPYIMECVCSTSSSDYSLEYKNITDIVMEDGHFVRLDCAMVFTTYSGKPDLGFTW